MGINQYRWRGQSIDMLHHNGNLAVRMKRQHTCTHFIQNNAQGIDVAVCIGTITLDLLRR